MADLLKNAARAVWGAPLTGLILIAGCALTAATGFVQVRGFRAAFSGLFRKGTGFGVSPFAALCTSLSATVGTGNIIGVTAAVASGGAGAPQHLTDAVTTGGASAALVASIVHYGAYSIPELKTFMRRAGVPVRMV